MRFLLNAREAESLRDYERAYWETFGRDPKYDPEAVFFLGDNASNRRIWSCSSNRIPTLRTNSGLMWIAMWNRWYTPKELLAAHGYPVYPDLAACMGVPVMDVNMDEARFLLGNAFHAACGGVVLLTGMCCIKERL